MLYTANTTAKVVKIFYYFSFFIVKIGLFTEIINNENLEELFT